MVAACLLIHGYCGSPFEMEPLAGPLRDAGFAVSNIRLPGHGTTVDDFLTTNFADWRAAADAWCETLPFTRRSTAKGAMRLRPGLAEWLRTAAQGVLA